METTITTTATITRDPATEQITRVVWSIGDRKIARAELETTVRYSLIIYRYDNGPDAEPTGTHEVTWGGTTLSLNEAAGYVAGLTIAIAE